MLIKITLLTLLAAVNCMPMLTDDQIEQQWQQYKRNFKSIEFYDTNEEAIRRQIFETNYRMILKHNAEAASGQHKYRLALNKFADLTDDEYRRYLNMKAIPLKKNEYRKSVESKVNVKDLPESVNWSEKGVVTAVKDQGQCGSCFAFSSIDSIESQHAIKTGRLVRLSPQNIIDCIPPISDEMDSCESGGFMHLVMEFVMKEGGVDTESSYPYYARVGRCNYRQKYSGASITGYVNVTEGDESALQEAVATVGPVTIGIDASASGFRFYLDGVFVDDSGECGSELNHGVVTVGYGNEDGQDYWLIKNSWGTVYGDGGYMKMARNNDNQCGVASYALYPTGVN
ncbi:procathepsin L-like [Oppia nitens]|uniref:procathepsin L-like n=1 Tax=Oppia nitens TaxID=1686743 RepID=UPI0023DBE126|nr:procathepsin L-like [Oppia nitens]